MAIESEKILIIGLPKTGKTTFLAALWHELSPGNTSNELKVKFEPPESEHLNDITRKWLKFEEHGRTVPEFEKRISLTLETNKEGKVFESVFEDISGETFKSQLEQRKWGKEYDHFVRQARGILLFIHPNEIKEPTTIMQALNGSTLKNLENIESRSLQQQKGYTVKFEDIPTQVHLVELLQFMISVNIAQTPQNIGIVISAWDLIKDDYNSPKDWLKRRLPLLDQYLNANENYIHCKIFGVSAQGGDYEKDIERLKKYNDPSERILVVDEDNSKLDITAPISWAINQ